MFSPTLIWMCRPKRAFMLRSFSLFISWVCSSYSMNGSRLEMAVAFTSPWAFFFSRHNLRANIHSSFILIWVSSDRILWPHQAAIGGHSKKEACLHITLLIRLFNLYRKSAVRFSFLLYKVGFELFMSSALLITCILIIISGPTWLGWGSPSLWQLLQVAGRLW